MLVKTNDTNADGRFIIKITMRWLFSLMLALIGDTDDGKRQVNSFLDSALHDDDETVKDYSEDGHSYAGTVVRGGLRGDSEIVFLHS